MEQNEQQFVKGFNRGYTITKYLPDLSKSILNGVGSTNDFIEGFASGKEEYEQEQTKTHLDELSEIRERLQGRDKDLERE